MCQSLRPRELKMPSTDSALEKMPAVVSLCRSATPTILPTPSARSSGVIAAVCCKVAARNCVALALPAIRGHRQQIRIRMLNLGQVFGGSHDPLQTLVIELVGRGPRSSSAKHSAHRDAVVFLRHILMDHVVRETGESGATAIKVGFDLVGGREFPDAVEDIGGLFSCQHSGV